jgi:hypothetical protein
MSFHLLHCLGAGVVLNVTVAPVVSPSHFIPICPLRCLHYGTGVRTR